MDSKIAAQLREVKGAPVPQDVRGEFEKEGQVSLSDESTVDGKEPNWLINDDGETFYLIRQEEEKVNVYLANSKRKKLRASKCELTSLDLRHISQDRPLETQQVVDELTNLLQGQGDNDTFHSPNQIQLQLPLPESRLPKDAKGNVNPQELQHVIVEFYVGQQARRICKTNPRSNECLSNAQLKELERRIVVSNFQDDFDKHIICNDVNKDRFCLTEPVLPSGSGFKPTHVQTTVVKLSDSSQKMLLFTYKNRRLRVSEPPECIYGKPDSNPALGRITCPPNYEGAPSDSGDSSATMWWEWLMYDNGNKNVMIWFTWPFAKGDKRCLAVDYDLEKPASGPDGSPDSVPVKLASCNIDDPRQLWTTLEPEKK